MALCFAKGTLVPVRSLKHKRHRRLNWQIVELAQPSSNAPNAKRQQQQRAHSSQSSSQSVTPPHQQPPPPTLVQQYPLADPAKPRPPPGAGPSDAVQAESPDGEWIFVPKGRECKLLPETPPLLLLATAAATAAAAAAATPTTAAAAAAVG